MEFGFKQGGMAISPWRTVSLLVIAVLTLAHVVAVAHGVLTIDMARDLYWADAIAQGKAFPLFGPPVGSFEVLGPAWFYLAALAAKLSGSMRAYFALLGVLAALKYWLAWRAGLRWHGERFAMLLVIAVALPGIASYQLVGVGHPQMLEVTVWGAALCLLRLRDDPARWVDALTAGVLLMLALHAHPTAIIMMPWAAWALWQWSGDHRLRAWALAAVGGLVPLLPRLLGWAFPALDAVAADNAPAVSGLGGSISGAIAVLQNLLWFQPLYIAQTLFASSGAKVAAWQIFWGLLLTTVIVGSAYALRRRDMRKSLLAAWITVAIGAIIVSVLRNHTPFYMLYALLPPLALGCALSWHALMSAAPRAVTTISSVTLSAVVLCALLISASSVAIARSGLVTSYLPLHSNMQNVTTSRHVESVHAVGQRDALARWLCAHRSAIALHGDLAVAIDTGVGLDFAFACPAKPPVVAIGGRDNAWVGMPLVAWQAAGRSPEVALEGAGLAPVKSVLSPEAALTPVTGRSYPPRLAAMIAAARQEPWERQFSAASADTVIVSSLLPTSPAFAVAAQANGEAQAALFQFANSHVLRCTRCGAEPVQWRVVVSGGLPETTSIVVTGEPAAVAGDRRQ